MASIRKYAGLPDLDPAPDIYETPELTDDNSTHPTTTLRSESPSDINDDEDTGIDRRQLDPDEARTHFLPSDQRDRSEYSHINSKRKSYRSSSRKRRKEGPELNGLVNGLELSSDNEAESFERKLARLRREVAEIQQEYTRRGDQKNVKSEKSNEEGQSLDSLNRVVVSISPTSASHRGGAATRLIANLSTPPISKEASVNRAEIKDEAHKENLRTAVVNNSRSEQDKTLSRVSDFDSRLALLESALGIDAIPLPTQERSTTTAVLPSLDKLGKQLTTLCTCSDSSLESISRRVRQLTLDAEKLGDARKAAKAAQEALRQEETSPTSSNARPPLARAVSKVSELEDPETISKINALYGTLSTIESLAPMLPSVLDRLRSLRSLHADAATASQTLTKLETRQEEMKEELRAWREGLEKVEDALEQGADTMKANTETVDRWVRDLEERMRNLRD